MTLVLKRDRIRSVKMEEKKVQEGFETSKKRNEEKDNRDVKKNSI